MSIVKSINILNLTTVQQLTQFLNPFVSQVVTAMQNGVSFEDNIECGIAVVQFPTTAGQNIQISHRFPGTPIGYLIARSSTFMQVCDGNSLVLGPTFANLKCNVAGATATVVFF